MLDQMDMVGFNLTLKEILISFAYVTGVWFCIFAVLMLAMGLVAIFRENFRK